MSKTITQEIVHCNPCPPAPTHYVNYFTGQFLTAREFQDEHKFLIGKHRTHNHYLHGWGTVCGLKVVEHPQPNCQTRFVVIDPGLALDCCGHEIFVHEPIYVDVTTALAAQPATPATNLLISLCYAECATEYVPALLSQCGCSQDQCQPSRVRESYKVVVELVDKVPSGPPIDPGSVSLIWVNTINVANASRIALDEVKGRLYVMTSATPGQVMVYDTANFCQLPTIPVNGAGDAIAVAPAGDFLYILRHDPANNYFFDVIDVTDLTAPKTINALAMSAATANDRVAIAVSKSDGKVSVLDAAANSVTIWSTGIQASLVGQPAIDAAKFAIFTTGTQPVAIAVTSDGNWLFVAESAPADNSVQAAKVATLPTAAPDVVLLTFAEAPALLAISGDNSTLFVSTSANKLHGYTIQETPTAFPEIGGGIDLSATPPLQIASSPNGDWVYAFADGSLVPVHTAMLATDPTHAVGTPLPLMAGAQTLVITADGTRLFTVATGSLAQPCAGVTVVDVAEHPCTEIFWDALNGCPVCTDYECVPLAVIPKYKPGQAMTDDLIDNRIRPLVPSSETLYQAFLCALEGTNGKQGPAGKDGANGLNGAPGAPGADGVGLEKGLTRIIALSWTHGKPSPLLSIPDLPGTPNTGGAGIVIAFDNDVQVTGGQSPIDSHVFQVLMAEPQTDNLRGFLCRCPILGRIVPVDPTIAGPLVTGANIVTTANARGVAFIFDSKSGTPQQEILHGGPDLWVKLRGDFVLDTGANNNKIPRAIDAEFVRADLRAGLSNPGTGDHPIDSPYGVQGGLFESWFVSKGRG
jgi:DNA-binding beta-propeller fold protein YncE